MESEPVQEVAVFATDATPSAALVAAEDSAVAPADNDNNSAFIAPQVVINSVYKHTRPGELEALLQSSEIPFKKVKKVPNKDFAFVTFDNDEDMNKCVTVLNGVLFRKHKLEVTVRNHVVDRNRKRPLEPSAGDENSTKRIKEGRDAVSPWWSVPYEDQLRIKQENMKKDCLGKMATELIKAYKIQNFSKKFMPSWLFEDALGLRYNEIIRSPEVVGYRNKCEFTFGQDVTGAPCVGFRVSSFHEGVLVASPEDSPTCPNAMKIVVKLLTDFIRSSPLKCYDNASHSGVWRTVMSRYSKRTHQLTLMFCVQLLGDRSDGTASTEELAGHAEFDSEMARLTTMLQGLVRQDNGLDDDESTMYKMCSCPVGAPDKEYPVTGESRQLVSGVCYQVFNGLSVPPSDLSYTVVFGEPMLEEILLDCNFQVSPQAFFQVNTRAAEALFSHVIDMIDADLTPLQDNKSAADNATPEAVPAEAVVTASSELVNRRTAETVCLDVCCGTGTIGICVAAVASKGDISSASNGQHIVLGVDLCAPAIDDAWRNAERNRVAPLIPRVVLGEGGEIALSAASTTISPTDGLIRGKAYFVPARAEALMEGILYPQGWRGCNEAAQAKGGAIPVEEQKRLHSELSQLRTIVSGKRLLAIVDPPREVHLHKPKYRILIYMLINWYYTGSSQ